MSEAFVHRERWTAFPTHKEDVSCSDPTSDTNVTATSADIVLDANETVSCTFTNRVNGTPGFSMAFSPDTINQGGISTLVFTIRYDRGRSDLVLTLLSVADLPATLREYALKVWLGYPIRHTAVW